MLHEVKKFLPSFVKRKGRKIGVEKELLLTNLLPKVLFKDFYELSEYKEIWIEIGFGNGEHLATQAKNNPDIGFIGSEVYENGIASMLRNIKNESLNNVRIFAEDARLLMEKLPENSIERVYIPFPDPWPKTKHYKRRIINNETIELLARIVKTELNIATDHQDYLEWIMIHMAQNDKFTWNAQSKSDWENPWDGYVKTRYNQKAEKEGRKSVFLSFCPL